MSKLNTLMTMSTLTAGMMLFAAVIGNTNIQPASATIVEKDHGASGFAPKEDPKAPGWDPNQAEEDAPGQLAEAPTSCTACAKDYSPGQEGLESEIIGPD